ncbi:CDP-glycerol glycerophosphotransferase family protein [Micrococcales bacterium 31B]|nr:CDP-glycerol glycerophosphotransferase family protein [Micrococcales bacterium 31B]
MTTLVLAILKLIARAIYACFKVFPTQKKVVLISRLSGQSSIDFRTLSDYLNHHYPNHTVVTLNHHMSSKVRHAFQVLLEMYHLATAQACVAESYVIAVSLFRHKPSLTIVQMWHALGALKRFGHLAIGRPEGSSAAIAKAMHMHENYDYVLTGGPASVETFARAFRVPTSAVKPIGLPRVDYLLSDNASDNARRHLGDLWTEISTRPVIVFAPTFRKGRKPVFDPLLANFCFDTHHLLIACHQRDAHHLPKIPQGAFMAPPGRVVEFLPIAVGLITDYSASAFDAAALGIPTYFWVHDISTYSARRGLTLDYTPGNLGGSVVSEDPQVIVDAVRNRTFDVAAWEEFASRYVAVRDGSCTEKLVELLELSP